MRKPSKTLAAVAAVLITATLTAAPPAVATPVDEPTNQLPETLTPVDEIPGQEAAAEIAKIAAAYRESFGGTAWDAKTKTLYVDVAAPLGKQADRRAAFQQAVGSSLRTSKSSVKTVFRSVPLSLTGQQDLVHRFMEGRSAWGGKSAVQHVVSAVVDGQTGRLAATVTGDLGNLRKAAQARFGDTVDLRLGAAPEPLDRDSVTAAPNRYYDTAPWDAGNALWDGQFDDRSVGEADCTQGFTWRRWADNVTFASTAGHCFARSDSVFNGSTTQRMGYVGPRYLNDGERADFEFVHITSGSAGSGVWVGGTPTAGLRSVVSADNDGTQRDVAVCSSGANGGVACGTIYSRTAAFTYLNYPGQPTIYNLTCVNPTSGFPIPGDSGGPVLSTINSATVKAWGQVTARLDCDPRDAALEWAFTTVKNIAVRASASIVVS